VQKVFPDGAVLTNTYQGALIKSSTLSGSSSTWLLEANIAEYNANESPEKIVIQGTGIKENFEHDWTYDPQGFPLSHSLGSGKTSLVQDHYIYNDLDQITQRHEFLSGSTTNYSYTGRRLESSQLGNGPTNTYAYDAAGNLTCKQGVDITYSPGRAVGKTADASVFDVSYDATGRMSKRTTGQSTFNFAYDSFGTLESYSSEAGGVSATCNLVADFEGETLQRNHADGSSDLMISPDFNIHTQADGSRIVRHKLFSKGYMLGTVSNTYESASSTRPLGGGLTVTLSFPDTKGNITHIFNSQDGTLLEQLEYDDYGTLISDASGAAVSTADGTDRTSTYECNQLDEATGILDFGGRWYDPLVGRFTTPDDILDMDLLTRTDGLNRFAFENNDPVNHTDPTGHWSWCSITGICVGAILVTGAIALTVATGGATGVLAAAAVGALAGGGIAGITYSIEHKNEENAGKFWGGYGTTVAINAAIGAATGAFGAVATPARTIAATGRLASKIGLELGPKSVALVGRLASAGGKSLVNAAGTVFSQATDRGVDNAFYGTHYDLFSGAGSTFAHAAMIGVATGALGGLKGASSSSGQVAGAEEQGAFKLRAFTGVRSVLAPKPTNPWAMPGITKQIMSATLKNLKPLAKYEYHATGLDTRVHADLSSFRSSFERANGF
jgi:RHS repeat-associated protein